MTSFFPKPAGRRSSRPDTDSSRARSGKPGRTDQPARWPASGGGSDSFAPACSAPGREPDAETPMLPGIKPVLELLEDAPQRIDTVFLRKGRHSKDLDRIADACRAVGVRFSLLDQQLFSRLYPGSSQGVVARLFESGYADIEDLLAGVMDAPLPLLLALDQIQDPGNAGTLARTLYAMGGAGLITTRHKGAYLGAAAVKASAGALERLPVCKVANLGQALDRAAKEGLTIYGAAGRRGDEAEQRNGVVFQDVFEFRPRLPAVLVLGSEESGMRQGMEKRCDYLLSIPMLRDFDSLNVAQAGAVIISFFARAVKTAAR